MKKWVNIGDKALPLLAGGLLLLFWEAVGFFQWLPPYLLPPPSRVIQALGRDAGLLWQHARVTLTAASVGFGIAIVAGGSLALLLDYSPLIRRVLYPYLITSQTIPIVTLAPLFAMWFGFGLLPKILIVVLVCFFPVTVSLLDGLASVDQELIDLMRSMGATPWQRYRWVKLPAALPSFFAGLKISGTYSIMGAVIGEWIGGRMGLGVYMLRVRQSFATDRVFAVIVVIVALSILVLKLIQWLERKAMPWMKTALPTETLPEGEVENS
ncbi:ABC transporter permease [Anoxynatronum buryatiense]|uniref:ABC-type nitrate/sulfonate/bicarbonate transport system, permease component n=1 Tax=Anoxynatronum buryatiense TaxID=489973 RepID=A0AA45WXH1_9CLOT|nr:ABC transporter permease [Anoxynatronum buryatiense]SMP62632.1 ABC-type nitrate/sulfonate/bicarbonate transport system, permease component [Anoxynatronum buryatiense]